MSACAPEWYESLSAYADEEIDAVERGRIESHLHTCASCRGALESMRRIGASLRARAVVEVPEHLVDPARSLAVPARARRWPAVMAAAVAAAAFLVGVGLWPAPLNDTLTDDVVGNHLRGFARARPVDFVSANPDEIRHWVRENLGYEIDVPLVPGHLLGVRRCRLAGEPTAALVYRCGEDALTVYAPRNGTRPAELAGRFAKTQRRCTAGPLNARICVLPESRGVTLAVAEMEEHELLSLLEASRWN